MNLKKMRRPLVLGSFLVGLSLTMAAWMLGDGQTDQTRYYNRGLIAYNHGDNDLAIKDFDVSYADYVNRLHGRLFFWQAPPSLEQAELAQEHKALALVKLEQYRAAMRAYKECLSLTTDLYLSTHAVLAGESDEAKIKAAYAKVKEDRKDAQIALEILLRAQPQLGQGKQPGDNDQPSEPANSSGSLNRNQVNQ